MASNYRKLEETLLNTGLQSPPPSPTKGTQPAPASKRRRELRESEDSNGEMSIVDYLYRTDPYRSIDQRSPWPLPLLRESPDEVTKARISSLPGLKGEIIHVLKRNGLQNISDFHIKSCTKPDFPGGDKPQLILCVSLDVDDKAPTNKWSDARKELGNLLSNNGFDNVLVELLDEDRAFQLSLLPINPTHSTVRAYERCRSDLLKLLETRITLDWVSMSAFRISRPSREEDSAVVILVKPDAVHDWEEIKLQFEKLLNAALRTVEHTPHKRIPIHVEFIPGGVSFLHKSTDKTERSGKDFSSSLTAYPKLGGSIGWRDKDGAGTLGGFFKIRVNDRTHRGLLTNYHVVAKSAEADPDADIFGTSYNDNAYSTSMWFPGRLDARETLKYIRKFQEYLTNRIRTQTKDRKERRLFGPTEAQDAAIRNNEVRLAGWKAKEKICQRMPLPLGNVLLSSGRALGPSSEILDWAFVEITDNENWQSIKNMNALPVANQFCSVTAQLPSAYGAESLIYENEDPQMPIQGFGALVKGQWYFKVGRSTGITSGICNGVEQEINLSAVRTRYDGRGRPVGTVHVAHSREFVIINAPLTRPTTQKEMCMPGDSGSLVIDVDGNCAGILFGMTHGKVGQFSCEDSDAISYAHAGLVTDIRSVRASIKHKTRIIRHVVKSKDGKETQQFGQGGPEAKLLLGHE